MGNDKPVKFSYNGTMLRFVKGRDSKGQLTLHLIYDASGAPFTRLSVIVPEVPLAGKLFWCKDWSENQDIVDELVRYRMIRKNLLISPRRTGYVLMYAYEYIFA